jgi:hypothetical protein
MKEVSSHFRVDASPTGKHWNAVFKLWAEVSSVKRGRLPKSSLKSIFWCKISMVLFNPISCS